MNSKVVFKYGRNILRYSLVYEPRKTYGLTVKPNFNIVLKVPKQATTKQINNFLGRKYNWIIEQRRFFKKNNRKIYQKKYVAGESFYFLGRQYQLVIHELSDKKIILGKNKIHLHSPFFTKDNKFNKLLIERWYDKKRIMVFNKIFVQTIKMFDYGICPKLEIRKMNKRWGSFLSNKKILLNPKLIHVSDDCIQYVICHELCHFKYTNHSRAFYRLLEQKIPNWRKRKEKLESYAI